MNIAYLIFVIIIMIVTFMLVFLYATIIKYE